MNLGKVSVEKCVQLELNGQRPAGYTESYRRAAVEEKDGYFYLTREAFGELLKKYDPTRNRRPPMTIPDGYDPDTSPDSPKQGSCCDPPKP